MFDFGNTPGDASSRQVIELDWDAYFLEFQAVHGGEPIFHQPTKRLLFRDGWTYSATDTRGPEWAPPEDPRVLKVLLLDYWRTRRAMIWQQLESQKGKLEDFKEMQRLRSAPLQRRVITVNEQGKRQAQSEKLDLPLIETQLALLGQALYECDEHLAELNKKDEE